MAVRKKLYIRIKNESKRTLKITEIIDADGRLEDSDEIKRTLSDGAETTIKAKRSTSYGPKIIIKIEDEKDTSIRCLIYSELSIDEDKPRCCYLIPDGDYVCDGTLNRFRFYKDESYCREATGKQKEFHTCVTIGEFKRCDRFIHISDTHIGAAYDAHSHGNNAAYIFNDETIRKEYEWHKAVMRTINEEFKHNNCIDMLGIIHTGDIFGSFDEQPKQGDYDAEDAFGRYFNEVYKKIYSRPVHYQKNTELDELDYLTSHLFEGVGNHDDGCAGKHKVEVWDDIKDRHDRQWRNGDNTIDSRMPSVKTNGGVDVKRKNAHYYWDWHGVRFIQINLSVVDGMFTKNNGYKTFGYNSYEYLKSVLEESKGMPVVICTHIGPEENRFVSAEDSRKFMQILRDNKNIIAILQGHTHSCMHFSLKLDEEDNIPVFDAGQAIVTDLGRTTKKIGCFWEFLFNKDDTKLICNRYKMNFQLGEEGKVSGTASTVNGSTGIEVLIRTDRTK